jgi:hypothetical protein
MTDGVTLERADLIAVVNRSHALRAPSTSVTRVRQRQLQSDVAKATKQLSNVADRQLMRRSIA